MLKNYLKVAVKVLLRRKVFTGISLFAISMTLVVLMLCVAFLDHVFGPMAPETRQDRTLVITNVLMRGDGNTWGSSVGYKLIDTFARDIPGVELLSIASRGDSVDTYVNNDKITSRLKRTDGAFWKLLDFTFLEGRPYTAQEVDDAQSVAVISRAARERFFGDRSALGGRIEVEGRFLQVIGVVENVSPMRDIPSAEIYAPITTAKSAAYRDELMGGFMALALARTQADIPLIQDEWRSRLKRVELPENYKVIVAPFETPFEAFARRMPLGDRVDDTSQAWKVQAAFAFVAVLFMLLPTVNLVNLNMSRIVERSSEIGVRKAFGASSRTLVGQFIVENIVLTAVGGFIAWVIAFLLLRAFTASGVLPYADLQLNARVFGWALLITLAFGLLSGAYPAWRMSRLHPAQCLQGGSR